MKLTATGDPAHSRVDWRDIKSRILAGLDLIGVYRDLGLRIVGQPNPETGKVQARAMGREDHDPSAFVNLRTGWYYAFGEPPDSLSFWDFAMAYGQFGEWAEMIRHYADLAKVDLPRFHKSIKGWIEEGCYTYRDRSGKVSFEVLRYRQPNGRKTFRQRRPDPKGGWIYDLDGVERVLYRLPELLDRPEETTWFVEGERDVDGLSALGFCATTSPQGAEAAGRRYWEDGLYAADLAGRNVVILPDNDPPGKSFGLLVARILYPVAASVKVVELPDLQPKGDVSDWIDLGHGVADLLRLADETPRFDPAAAEMSPDSGRDATAADLITANAGTRWLWEGWIPLSVLTLLTAEPSTGKTRFCLDLTKRIANLTTWPDGSPIVLPDGLTNRVLWIPSDNQHAELADAPARFGYGPDHCLLNTTVGDLYGGTELQTEEQLEDLEARIRRQRPALVIIDTITNTSDYKSQDTSDAKRQYKPLQEIAKRTGAAIMCVTHTNVAGKTLGRRADEKTRVTIRMESPDPAGQPNRRKLSVALSRLSVCPPALGVTMGDDGNGYDVDPPTEPGGVGNGEDRPVPRLVQRAIDFLRDRLAGGPVRVSVLRTEADHCDPAINNRFLYRAKEYLGVEEFIDLRQKKWWKIPNGLDARNGHADEDTPF